MTRNVLNVFIASPSDLIDERKILREVVDRLNKIIGKKLNWYIELFGWEDTLPGASRPQSIINKDVEICQLFIGIIWKRWGQSTGVTDSGFKEEFDLAFKRKKYESEPEIFMYLKKIDTELLGDPGEQLKKVINFRSWLNSSKELLYKEFVNNDDWDKLIYDNLLEYILKINSDKIKNIQEINEKLKFSSQGEEVIFKNGSIDEFLSNLKLSIDNNNFFISGFWDRARLMLVSKALYAEVYDTEYLGNHDINVFYTARNEWVLTDKEKVFLTKSALHNSFDYRPFWFWYKDLHLDEIQIGFNEVIISTSDSLVLFNSFKILFLLGYIFNEEFIWEILANDNIAGIDEIIEFLNCDQYPDIFQSLIKKNEQKNILPAFTLQLIKNKATEGNICKNPENEIIKLLSDKQNPDDSVTNIIIKYTRKLTTNTLKKFYKNSNSKIRESFIKEVISRKELSEKEIDFFISDASISIRELAIKQQILLKKITSIDEIKNHIPSINNDIQILELLFKQKSYEELLDNIWFLENENYTAYSVLSNIHFDKFKETIYNDLTDEFGSWYDQSIKFLNNKFGKELTVELLKKINTNTVEFIKNRLIEVALKALYNLNDKISLKFARKYIKKKKDYDIVGICLQILERFGNKIDANYLLNNFEKFEYENKILAVKVSIILSPGIRGNVNKFLNKEKIKIKGIALDYLFKLKPKSKIKFLFELLYNDNDSIRLKALAILKSLLSFDKLENILVEYLKSKKYYYDVVTWLDRVLYSNNNIRVYYSAELEKKIDPF